jgi:sarcosine oxidase subunit gamma
MPVSVPEALHPLAPLLRPGRHGAEGAEPLRLEAPQREIVQVLARRGQAEALAAALGGLPGPGGSSTTRFGTLLWLQPGVWAVVRSRDAEGSLGAALRDAVGNAASVVDQTHGRSVIAVEGLAARRMLAKGVRIDLYPSAFPVGAVAVTECAHLGVALHRAAADRYEFIVFSTLAREFWHWITEAAGEFGYTVV